MPVNVSKPEDMRRYFNTGATHSYDFRKQQLQKLQAAIKKWEPQLQAALMQDLHKSAVESYATEIGFLLTEVGYAIKNLASWMKPEKVSSPLFTFPSSSKIIRDPWGVTLIIAPWNYPIQLLLGPLIGAIAGGNCAVLKPSELAPYTANVLQQLVKETFEEQYINVVMGDGAEVVPELIKGFHFDHVFFTGSVPVGRQIALLTAGSFIPTVLELGGKSPCIVDASADLKVAAKRITWGKFTNAGQTCVAPDYLLVQEGVKDKLVALLQENIQQFYGADPQSSPDYGRIINDKRFDKLVTYLQEGNIMSGGQSQKEDRYIAPTLVDGISLEQPVMKEEIFGPILPIITFRDHNEAMEIISHNPDPLSLYLFTTDKQVMRQYEDKVPFGGGCINNTLVHLANPKLPFGGVATSGIGAYHGKYGFDTYTRPKAVLKTSNLIDAAVKYPPYAGKMKLFKWLTG